MYASKFCCNNEILPFCSESKYHGVKLERSLAYCRYVESFPKIYIARRTLGVSCWLGLGWWSNNVGNSHLRTLVYSSADYCTPAWCSSVHVRLLNPAINDALPIVSGCLRPTLVDKRPVLVGIQPAELGCKGAIISLARRATQTGHLLHSALTCPPHGNARHLKSRHPFVPTHNHPSVHLTAPSEVRRSGKIIDGSRIGWTTSPRPSASISDIGTHPSGMAF